MPSYLSGRLVLVRRHALRIGSIALWPCVFIALHHCSSFGSSDDVGVAPDGGSDAANETDANPVVGDAADIVDADPEASSPTCESSALLVGNEGVAAVNDTVPVSALDAYGYVAQAGLAPVLAHCAKLYVSQVEEFERGAIAFGVYDDSGQKPSRRLASARFSNVKIGWNVATLDAPVTIVIGTTYWLAFTPTEGSFNVVVSEKCGTGQFARSTQTGIAEGKLPDLFEPNGGGVQCAASAFLTR